MAGEGRLAAIVLAGGQARRLGGVDKPGIRFGQRSLVGSVVMAAAEAGASRVVIVGPKRAELAAELAGAARTAIEFTCERPSGAGPVPAVRAGLDLVTEPRLLLLAADLPFLTPAALRALVGAANQDRGAVLADPTGQSQWLMSCWRTAELRAALADYAGSALRGLLAPLPHVDVAAIAAPGEPPYWLDCDTPDDLAAAAERLGAPPEIEGAAMTALADWITAACAELGVDAGVVDERVILDLARDAAHQVDRPAAPVTAFLLGVAVGNGRPLAATAERLSALAAKWPGTR